MRTIGHYRLKSLIGSGGTSEVYAAEHTLLGDSVAIKLLRDPAHADALVAEGMNVRAIDHPNVVRVLDAGIDPETHGCYLVMEHVRGETLATRLHRGPLPEPTVRQLGADLADAVAAAHARGIVHRDLKPANVMLDGERPKIVDFGIAKHLGERSAVTTARVIGTLAYMAPEQLASGLIAPCTDVWALGMILFEALTGRLPFDSFADGRCAQLAGDPLRASAITTLSPELDTIIARCLARDPAGRPSAADLAAMLRGERAVVDDERVTVDAGPLVPRPPAPVFMPASTGAPEPALAPAPIPWPQRRRRGIVLGASVTVAAACAAIVAAFAVATGGSASNASVPSPGAVDVERAGTADVERAAATGNGDGERAGTADIGRAGTADVGRTAAPPAPDIERTGTADVGPAATTGTGAVERAGATGAADVERAGADATAAGERAAATGDERGPSPESSRILVRSRPMGARVLVDGKLRGVTPVEVALELPQAIVVERAGYRSSRVHVERAGPLDVRLKRVRQTKKRKETLD